MTHIPQELIEKALALTGKIMEDMNYPMIRHDGTSRFSYPKFFYYLLSPEFIEVLVKKYSISFDDDYREYIRKKVSEGCTEYQSGDTAPIISLLTKI